MGLIQSVVEASGIPTVSVSMLEEVTVKVKPPRVLLVPFPMGYPLGEPERPDLQRAVIGQALALLGRGGSEPIYERFVGAGP